MQLVLIGHQPLDQAAVNNRPDHRGSLLWRQLFGEYPFLLAQRQHLRTDSRTAVIETLINLPVHRNTAGPRQEIQIDSVKGTVLRRTGKRRPDVCRQLPRCGMLFPTADCSLADILPVSHSRSSTSTASLLSK